MVDSIVDNDSPSPDLKWLLPAIKEWGSVHCSYANYFRGEDALYWYNERPNIGVLAAAACKANMHAVEEYSAMKKHPLTTDKQTGRIDLYIASGSNDAAFEAKQAWVRDGTTKKTLMGKMEQAIEDAKRIQKSDGNQRIGVVFYTLMVGEDKVLRSSIQDRINVIRSSVKPDLLSWCFPKSNASLRSSIGRYDGIYWPGVIMAMKKV